MVTMPQGRPDQFQIEEAYKQVKLNARQRAIDDTKQLFAMAKNAGGSFSIDELISEAKKLEAYYLTDIVPPAPPSGILKATNGPAGIRQ